MPTITVFLVRADSHGRYPEGTELAIDCICLLANTAPTSIPRSPITAGIELAGIELAGLVGSAALAVRTAPSHKRGIHWTTLATINRASGADPRWCCVRVTPSASAPPRTCTARPT